MKQFQQWLADHSITTHAVAAGFTAATVAFYEVPAFHDAVVGAYGHFPQWAKTAVTVGLALYSWYRKSQISTPQLKG